MKVFRKTKVPTSLVEQLPVEKDDPTFGYFCTARFGDDDEAEYEGTNPSQLHVGYGKPRRNYLYLPQQISLFGILAGMA